MNIRQLNESIKNLYNEDFITEDITESDIDTLRHRLENDVVLLKNTYQNSPYLQARALELTIEDIFQKSWWEVVDCNIADELIQGVSLDDIVHCIIDNIKPEFKDTTEVVTEGMNDEYYVGDEETGRIYKGEDNAKSALDALKSRGIDVIMIPVDDEKH